jgi:carbonic anhydrase
MALQIREKIKLDQITAWVLGILCSAGTMGFVWWLGKKAYIAEETRKLNVAKAAEEMLAEAQKSKQKSEFGLKQNSTPASEEPTSFMKARKSPVAQVKFGYEGPSSPWRWSDLNHSFSLCQTGKKQSPLDISTTRLEEDLKPIKFNYRHDVSDFYVSNQTMVADVTTGSWIEYDSERFDLKFVFFRTPSEHRSHGLPYDAEIQLYHEALTGKPLIISLLASLANGVANQRLETVNFFNRLSKELPRHDEETAPMERILWQDLIPDKHTYWSYQGSLTFPPCTENVEWLILTDTVTIPRATLSALEKFQRSNARPIQLPHGRVIARSNR